MPRKAGGAASVSSRAPEAGKRVGGPSKGGRPIRVGRKGGRGRAAAAAGWNKETGEESPPSTGGGVGMPSQHQGAMNAHGSDTGVMETSKA